MHHDFYIKLFEWNLAGAVLVLLFIARRRRRTRAFRWPE